MLEHGGRLRRAAEHCGSALTDWVDLSTGISPWAYPVPPVPETAWQRLPEDDDGLEEAAARYYGSAELLAVAGSQPAIQALPAVLPGAHIRVLAPGYAEHAHAWRERRPRLVDAAAVEGALDDSDVLVLVQPNNPTGVHFERARLLDWHARLARRGGWLVVDEAFADTTPAHSLAPLAGRPGLVVLRSLGKFFGLAGARVGFVFGAPEKLDRLREVLGPWPVSHPSRFVAKRALEDSGWQAAAHTKLAVDSRRLAELLAPLGEVTRSALFCAVRTAQTDELIEHFARRAILTRHYASTDLLRFGLPESEAHWQRLAATLAEWAPAAA